MALIENTLEGRINRVDIAIKRIKSFDPLALGIMDQPYYVAYSGGKDSDAIRILCELAGVEHELWHNHTTVDAPETVRYVRSIPGIRISYPEQSMWRLIEKMGSPPTRRQRYCCRALKEREGKGRVTVTGVRWAESINRLQKRGGVEVQTSNVKNEVILNADNDESRRLFETCRAKGKRVINPIIDWSDADVWELFDSYGCKSNPLYQCGYHRVGCVGCPMSTKQAQELERYSKYKLNYIKAFDRMLLRRREKGRPCDNWETGEEVYRWWISGKALPKEIEGQMMLEAQ